jgi:hypothetical protein
VEYVLPKREGRLGSSKAQGPDQLQRSIILVRDRPYAVWHTDISSINQEFLANFDPDYFAYLADTHLQAIAEDSPDLTQDPSSARRPSQRQLRAALALRNAYSQGLESLFSLLFATLQAPHCVPAWMLLYWPRDLRKMLKSVSDHDEIARLLNLPSLSWSSIAQTVLTPLVLEDHDKEVAIKRGFADLWSRFAEDYTNDVFRDEYNSIKHGLRARSGGFSLAIGIQPEAGVPAPQESMRSLGHSDYGSSFFMSQRIGRHKNQLSIMRNSRNWMPEDIANALRLVSISLQDLVSFLFVANGRPASEVIFAWPDTMDAFSAPWKSGPQMGVTSMHGFGLNIPDSLLPELDKDEMLKLYDDGNVLANLNLSASHGDERPLDTD